MTRYLLDTNIISNAVKPQPSARPAAFRSRAFADTARVWDGLMRDRREAMSGMGLGFRMAVAGKAGRPEPPRRPGKR